MQFIDEDYDGIFSPFDNCILVPNSGIAPMRVIKIEMVVTTSLRNDDDGEVC